MLLRESCLGRHSLFSLRYELNQVGGQVFLWKLWGKGGGGSSQNPRRGMETDLEFIAFKGAGWLPDAFGSERSKCCCSYMNWRWLKGFEGTQGIRLSPLSSFTVFHYVPLVAFFEFCGVLLLQNGVEFLRKGDARAEELRAEGSLKAWIAWHLDLC